MQKAMSAGALLVGLALTGCGSSGASTTPTHSPPKPIPFKSRAIVKGALPAQYTCDGKNIPPPLEWGAVPSSTQELALLVIGFIPGSTPNSYNLSVEWAVAGLSPKVHHLAAGQLPSGAFLGGRNNGSTKYSICPEKGTRQQYEFALYAVPTSIKIPRGFAGVQILSRIGASTAPTPASAAGIFEVAYKRR
jgi:phosphatidylethanolamine-binding protein (PEBP) family uncharacterized protein